MFIVLCHENSTLQYVKLQSASILVSKISKALNDRLKTFIKHEKQTKKGLLIN